MSSTSSATANQYVPEARYHPGSNATKSSIFSKAQATASKIVDFLKKIAPFAIPILVGAGFITLGVAIMKVSIILSTTALGSFVGIPLFIVGYLTILAGGFGLGIGISLLLKNIIVWTGLDKKHNF